LVNHNQTPRGRSTREASVTVTFDLTGEPITPSRGENGKGDSEQQKSTEWVSPASYESPTKAHIDLLHQWCNLHPYRTHEQLNRLRIQKGTQRGAARGCHQHYFDEPARAPRLLMN